MVLSSRQRDLNPRPTDYESVALPTTPCRHFKITKILYHIKNEVATDKLQKLKLICIFV